MRLRKLRILAGSFACLVGAAVPPLRADHTACDQHEECPLVRRYAPVLWPADDETIYPTLQHPFVFDGLDNDGNGLKDLEDPCEIDLDYLGDGDQPCPEGRPPRPKPSARTLKELIKFFRDLEEARRPPRVVLYAPPQHLETHRLSLRRTGEIDRDLEAGRVPEALQSAFAHKGLSVHRHAEAKLVGQARLVPGARRMDADRWTVFVERTVGEGEPAETATIRQAYTLKRRGSKIDVFQSQDWIEFWFYYLYDHGLNDHRHDGEHAVLYVDCLGDHETQRELGDVRAVVGAGHEDHTSNNVLVAPFHGGEGGVWPQRLPQHIAILVELGKHASAPDRNLDGRFDFGFDSNVFPQSVWGTRDLQAADVGRIRIDRFEPWFSFPRDPANVLCEEVWDQADHMKEYRRDFSGTEQRARRLVAKAGESRLQALCRQGSRYRLFPMDDMRLLHERLRAGDRRAVESFLEEHKRCFWGEEAPATTAMTPEVFERMRGWVLNRPRDSHLERRDVWNHHDYKRPNDAFKPFLFNHLSLGVLTRVDGGNYVSGVALQIAQVNLSRVPVLRRLAEVPVLKQIVGGPVLDDSTLELQGTWDHLSRPGPGGERGNLHDVGVVYNGFRGRYFGWYGGAHYRTDAERNPFRMSGGLAISVPSLRSVLPVFPRSASAVFKIGIEGAPFRERDRSGDPVSMQFGLSLHFGFWKPRHPLLY